jgi:flavin-dependent thymidylate synthase
VSSEIARWADVAMYHAKPTEHSKKTGLIEPRVTLVHMTPQPLQQLAAAADLYAGHPVHHANEISQSKAINWFEDMSRTVLAAPLEFIDLHFLFEGVTRAWMDQLVRQRTAVYVAESLRFSVKEDLEMEVVMPPSIAKVNDDDPKRRVWDEAVRTLGLAYHSLVNAGVPAEDARGLLPLNTAVRVHYKTNLRGLAQHAGMRLCSQAQWEWKQVWHKMILAIREYGPESDRWQQAEIAKLFRPICYQTGRCQFRADTDRFCSIRDRVEAHYSRGEGPELWHDIDPLDAMREGAARKAPVQ